MKLNRFLAVTIVVLLVGTMGAYAQVTANLTGLVTIDGAPLPGATITASSVNLQGKRVTTTDVNGNYNFAGLPAGPYKVTIEMQGMQTVAKTVNLSVGLSSRADATMKMAAVSEAITVTAAAPAVLEQTEVGSNIQQQTINKLPTGRTVTGVALLMPGTTSSGPRAALVISGATADQNLITVDGANIQENLRGQTHTLFIEDAIQETTVLTGTVSAEYGRFTGGVVNSITKSGGNEFHGTYRDNLDNPAWTMPTKYPGDKRSASVLNQTHEATFGGRIIRDRLWFFGAGRKAKTTNPGAYSLAGGPIQQYTVATDAKRWEGKLTGQITPKHSLVVTYLKSPLTATNNNQLGVVEPQGLDPSIQQGNDFWTGHYNGIITNNLLVEALYSRKTFAFIGFGGDNPDPVQGSPLLVFTPSFALVGDANAPYFCGICTQETRNNHESSLKATYFWSSKSLGTHNIVAGYDKWAETRLSNNYQSPTNFVLNTYSSGFNRLPDGTATFTITNGADWAAYYPILTPSLGSNLATNSAFVNDKWDLDNHWNFNIGIRYDKNNAVNSLHQYVSKDKSLSPRLGVNYDVLGDGKYKITAGYSVYAGRLAEGVTSATSAAGNPASFYYLYNGPTMTGLTSRQYAQQFFTWFNSVGGLNGQTPFYTSIPGSGTVIRGSLNTPHVREITLGGGMAIGNGFVRADLIDRKWKDFYVNVRNLATGQITINGSPNDLTVLANSNAPKRTYKAIQLQGQYRLFSRVQLGGNYTYSKTRGNAVQENAGSGPIAEGFSSTFYPEYNNFPNNSPVGYLPSDQTHKLRAWASYDWQTPFGTLDLSGIQRLDSGVPYSAVGTISTSYVTTNPGYVAPPLTTSYYFSKRGAYRTDTLLATDLSATFSFRPIHGLEFYALGQVFNAFNNQKVVNLFSGASQVINTSVRTARTSGSGLQAFNPFTTTPKECPVGNTAAQCTALGANYQLTSAFGTATSKAAYQAPRSYTMAVGFRF